MAIIKIKNPAIDLDAAEIPNLPASKITSGTLDNARISLDAAEIPNLDTAKITTGTLSDARVPDLNASKITAGTIATARLGSGTASSSTFLRGDGSFATPPLGGITNVDRWKMSNQNYSSGSTMTIGWSRDTILNGMPYGTGLTQSGGIFSFPSTGLYKIDIMSYIYNGNNTHTYVGIAMKGTSDAFSSNVQQLGVTYNNIPIAQGHANLAQQAIYKIDNTSNNKFKLMVETNTGTPGFYNTYITFMRLGDG